MTASSARRSPPWVRHLPAGADPAALDLLAEDSLPAAWHRRWSDDPARPVLGDGERWLSGDELEERTGVAARRVLGAGLEPGDRVVISGATSLDLAVAHVAVLRAGLVAVPVNAASREREVAQIVHDCRPAGALVDDPVIAGWVEAASESPVVTCDVRDIDLPLGSPRVLDACGPDDAAMLCYTSGTTGAPKGARLTHGNLLASPAALALAWRWTPEDRLVLALPLFHVHGLGVGLHGTLLAGASAVLVPRFSPDAVLDAARAEDASLFFGVPTMYQRLARSSRTSELGRLRLCVSGSAPLAPRLFEQLRVDAGVTVLERYGMTETLMTVSNPHDGERRAGTVGFPLPGVEIDIADDGELRVRGPNVFDGYWERAEVDRLSFIADDDGNAPWFRTGDIVTVDDDGYLSIIGRARELIISGGFNVFPREVEDVLRSVPGVADVAVVGTPSDEWGEIVTAVVVADGPLDADALLAVAADELAPYKRPRVVRFVDELPRNALGKVLRHEL